MPQLPEDRWRSLRDDLTRVYASRAPEWTNAAGGDPGITLLEALTYTLEEILQRPVSDEARPWLTRIGRLVDAHARSDRTPDLAAERWSGVKRLHFFAGRLLTADDFRDEQEYHARKRSGHLRALHGSGIVSGLTVEGSSSRPVTVRPGVAIDPEGREIQLMEHLAFDVPSGTLSPAYLVIEYAERRTDPVPSSFGDAAQASRIEEGCRVVLSATADGSGVVLGRLLDTPGAGWQPDPSFTPKRAS